MATVSLAAIKIGRVMLDFTPMQSTDMDSEFKLEALLSDISDVFTDADLDRGMWARISDAVTRRPWRSAIVSTVVLLVLAAPTLFMEFGQTDGTSFPDESPAYRSTVLIEDGFGPGQNGALVVAAQLFTPVTFPVPEDDSAQDDLLPASVREEA